MNRRKQFVILALFISTLALLSSCTTLRPATSIIQDSIQRYRYVYITPTQNLSSSSGSTSGNIYYSVSKTVNPADVISGKLTREGFIRIPEIKPEFAAQTLIINYGESGKRNVFLGYAIEVTIQLINAQTLQPVCTCTAEGMGSTEADDIREAIGRCLEKLLRPNAL
ncbi:MAG: hypothetical protein ACK5XN_25615 [Bacteroidota bacterium]|jgi:hypothetical protein